MKTVHFSERELVLLRTILDQFKHQTRYQTIYKKERCYCTVLEKKIKRNDAKKTNG